LSKIFSNRKGRKEREDSKGFLSVLCALRGLIFLYDKTRHSHPDLHRVMAGRLQPSSSSHYPHAKFAGPGSFNGNPGFRYPTASDS
jgi:hypothetical protein